MYLVRTVIDSERYCACANSLQLIYGPEYSRDRNTFQATGPFYKHTVAPCRELDNEGRCGETSGSLEWPTLVRSVL